MAFTDGARKGINMVAEVVAAKVKPLAFAAL